MEKEITHNDLPKAIGELLNEIYYIKQILIENKSDRVINSDCWLNLPELCKYLPDKPSKATVYSWVQNRTIPFHKGAKKLRFLKSEIDFWLKAGKMTISSVSEISPESYLKRKGGK